MNVNTSLVTDTSVAVAETSVDAYRDQISRHIDNDLSAHTSIELHLTGFYEQAPAATHLVADATLRMLLTDGPTQLTEAYALPALIQPGTYIPSGSGPVILRQPASQTAVVGSNVTFNVYVASSSPGYYQWTKNGTNITGANDATLTLVNVQLSAAASYACVVSNIVSTVTSASATLAVTTV